MHTHTHTHTQARTYVRNIRKLRRAELHYRWQKVKYDGNDGIPHVIVTV